MATAFQQNAFQDNAFQIDGGVVVPPQTDSGMAVGYSRSKLRKWIEELKEARAAVAREARKEATGKRKAKLQEAARAAEEVIYAATLAASERLVNEAKIARQTQRLAHLLNTAVRAETLAAATVAATAARRYADEMEEEEEVKVIFSLLH